MVGDGVRRTWQERQMDRYAIAFQFQNPATTRLEAYECRCFEQEPNGAGHG